MLNCVGALHLSGFVPHLTSVSANQTVAGDSGVHSAMSTGKGAGFAVRSLRDGMRVLIESSGAQAEKGSRLPAPLIPEVFVPLTRPRAPLML
jgi:hypothetical protein